MRRPPIAFAPGAGLQFSKRRWHCWLREAQAAEGMARNGTQDGQIQYEDVGNSGISRKVIEHLGKQSSKLNHVVGFHLKFRGCKW